MLISFRWFRSGRRGYSHTRRLRHAGFTLTELLVVISIMLVLTTVFLVRQQTFNSSTLLRTLSYSVALSVRQAQAYGVSIRESAAGAFDTSTSARAYGVYFDSSNPSSYLLFADLNNDGRYVAANDLIVQTFTLSNGYTINKICATTSVGTLRCSPSAITTLNIMFKRPNPDACISTSFNTSACAAVPVGEQYSSGYIQLMNSVDTRSITVLVTGQISVGAKGS